MDYYYNRPNDKNENGKKNIIKTSIKNAPIIKYLLKRRNENRCMNNITDEVYVSYDGDFKYVFIGKMSRIQYRTNLDWKKSDAEYKKLKTHKIETSDKCQYLSTLHESFKCAIPDNKKYDVRYIQDGYLPPNYPSKYLKYHPNNVQYYAWDKLGEEEFVNHEEPVSIMPFRRKLLLPIPQFPKTIKNILVATSGPGDWTAIKNRSDEDIMFMAFIEIARRRPDINIVYRYHPTWTHPEHNGVYSIKRLEDYINYSGLKNIRISSNIPLSSADVPTLSFMRSSFEEDLAQADIVFGEHSVSMIDAGLKNIPFASVNLSGRRDLFDGITRLGFPHCESIEEILNILDSFTDQAFHKKFCEAVTRYNEMTEQED